MVTRDLKDFYFSQNSLNDFKNCPKKFEYKYINKIRWNLDDENYYENLKNGFDFHLICERYFKNIPTGIENDSRYLQYEKWLCDIKNNIKIERGDALYPEYEIKLNTGKMLIQAKYDLIVEKDDEFVIYDWKTQDRQLSLKSCLKKMQTIVYMYILKESMGELFKKCKQISMIYYHVQTSNQVKIEYTDVMHTQNKVYIQNLIDNIKSLNFNKCDVICNSNHCKFCEYDVLCSK